MSAITCLTAQNTLGVQGILAVEPRFVALQVQSVVSDIGVDSVKTGMLLNEEIILQVVELVRQLALPNLVVDPVMVSRTGAQLLADEAVLAMQAALIPLAAVVTPNIHEAQLLSGLTIRSLDDMQVAAKSIGEQTARVLVKGGALAAARGTDVFFDGHTCTILPAETVETPHTHGSGCTLAAAITAQLARGEPVEQAIHAAKAYVTGALKHSLAIGHGQGPLGHFWPLL